MNHSSFVSFALLGACSLVPPAPPVEANPTATPNSEVRTLGEFRAIDLAGVISVEVKIDRVSKVEVRGDADLRGLVTTTVDNGVLVIDTKPLPRRRITALERASLDSSPEQGRSQRGSCWP